jgi:hypothetical protein
VRVKSASTVTIICFAALVVASVWGWCEGYLLSVNDWSLMTRFTLAFLAACVGQLALTKRAVAPMRWVAVLSLSLLLWGALVLALACRRFGEAQFLRDSGPEILCCLNDGDDCHSFTYHDLGMGECRWLVKVNDGMGAEALVLVSAAALRDSMTLHSIAECYQVDYERVKVSHANRDVALILIPLE